MLGILKWDMSPVTFFMDSLQIFVKVFALIPPPFGVLITLAVTIFVIRLLVGLL